MKHYFLTGLARCKSGWLSNLFTWGTSFCWHDVFYGIKSDQEFIDKMDPHFFAPHFISSVGIADAALLQCWRGVAAKFPDSKWVVVDRSSEDAFNSSVRAFEGVSRDGMSWAQKELHALCEGLKPLHIQFNDLADVQRCYDLAGHLGINIGPAARIRQLCDMNIQIHPPILKSRLESLRSRQTGDSQKAA